LAAAAEAAPPNEGKKKEQVGGGELADGAFQDFWQQYPRQEGIDGARREFKQAVAGGTDPKDITAGAMRYAATRMGKPEQFTAMPRTWLRDGRWKDKPSANGGGVNRTPYRPQRKPSVAEITTRMYADLVREGR